MTSRNAMTAVTDRPAQRGYSLPFVIMILLLLSVALASLLFVLTAGARSTESMIGRRKLFYGCDGVSRIASVAAQNYFGQTAQPDAAALLQFICSEGGGCDDCDANGTCTGKNLLPTFSSQTPSFQVTSFGVPRLGTRRLAPLESGPFAGMVALQDGLDLRLVGHKPDTGWSCEVQQELVLAKIAMFQFFVFSDQPYTDWNPGPEMGGGGRLHANGDVCFFGDAGPLFVERATSSTKLFPGPAGGCLGGTGSKSRTPTRVAIVEDPTFDTDTTNTDPIEPAATIAQSATATSSDHFREFATRTEATWKTDANTLFAGHLQDAAHGVPPLKLPVFVTTPLQEGRDAGHGTVPNTGRSRLLVDPVLTTDDASTASQKFAFKADIRIINGVWYKRDIGDSRDIGEPIWSDHPGTLTTLAQEGIIPAGKGIGQDDIFSTGTRPKRFSYYTFTSTGNLARAAGDTTPAVVSYGPLHRVPATGGTPVWGPGVRCGGGAVHSVFDTASCTPAGTIVGERVLRGTRSGLRDGHAQNRFDDSDMGGSAVDQRANILPLNFDVAAFQNALATCTDNELGSHFPGSCVAGNSGRRFNGIVYVASVWPGIMNTTPDPPPAQGSRGSSTKAPLNDGAVPTPLAAEQPALPEPLCGGSAGAIAFAGTSTGFDRVACSTYAGSPSGSTAAAGARPTAVRVFNARNLDQMAAASGGLPALSLDAIGALTRNPPTRGLSIVSNLPVYVLGDANLASDPADLDESAPWVPFLVGGDVVTLLSNAWTDDKARWSVSTATTARTATPTAYHLEILAGWAPTTGTAFSGGIHNFPRFLENWSSVPAKIRGSLVIGWAAVHANWGFHCCNSSSYSAPVRDWGFDQHLENILNQPPGAPLYDVQATRRWKR